MGGAEPGPGGGLVYAGAELSRDAGGRWGWRTEEAAGSAATLPEALDALDARAAAVAMAEAVE